MELQREESGEMYLPDDQGEHALPEAGMQNFSVQGLLVTLTSLDSEVTVVQLPLEEYALLLEVTMAERTRHPRLPTFSWNSSMVLHILKRDPALRDLECVQVDGLGTAYLYFYDKQGHKGLKQEVTENLWAHMAEAFSEWISHSAHFMAILLPLVEGW